MVLWVRCGGVSCLTNHHHVNTKKRINTTKKNTTNIVQCSKCYYLNVTDALLIPMIFSFLSYHEKAHANEEFSRENSKPCCES